MPLPADGLGPVDLSASLDLSEANPAGGFYVGFNYTMTIPGDDPATPVVETEYIRSETRRLDHANGRISLDSDGNGEFEDEVELTDDDRDCYSGRRAEQENEDPDYDEELELEIEGIVSAFDEAAGMITLINPVLENGELQEPLPDPLVLSSPGLAPEG